MPEMALPPLRDKTAQRQMTPLRVRGNARECAGSGPVGTLFALRVR